MRVVPTCRVAPARPARPVRRLLRRLVRPAALLSAAACCLAGATAAFAAGPAVSVGSRVYTDREVAVWLERARQAFRSGELVEGVSHLRRLLERPADSFVVTTDGLRGARDLAEELLRHQLPSIQRFFESAQAAEASAALASAIERGNVSSLREIVRRFPTTDAAFRAADRLGSIAFDGGDYAAAARIWGGLLSDPRESAKMGASTSAKLLVALRRSGRDGRASELALRLSGKPLNLAGRSATAGALLRDLPPSEIPLASVASRGTFAAGLTAPAFGRSWVQGSDPGLVLLTELWAGWRRGEARPLASAAGAVLVADELVVRGVSKITGCDPATGEVNWIADLDDSGLAKALPNDLHGLTRFEERYAGSGVLGRITTDGERLYAVVRSPEPAVQPVRTASSTPMPAYDRGPEGEPTNRLVALPLGPAGGRERRPVWEVAGATGASMTAGGRYFFGPPVDAGDCLLAVSETRQCLSLVAIERADGSLRWEQPLGFVARPVAADAERAAAACIPAVAEGVAVCPTNAGFAAAVDVLRNRLLWAFEYAAGEPRGEGTGWRQERDAYRGDNSIACPVVIRGGSVVLMPHDSRFVHCLDLRTGALRWSVPREDGLYIGCVTDSAALVVGRSFCRSLSIVSGSPLWSARLGAPSGTGVATGATYLLPLECGLVACVDLATGRRIGFDVPRDPVVFRPLADGSSDEEYAARWRPGNLYSDGRSLFSVGPAGVTRLETAAQRLQTADATADPMELARAELAAGLLERARPRLEAIERSEGDSRRDEARGLLQELHYLRLSALPAGEPDDSLAELDRLSRTPADRARYLLHAAESDVARDDPGALQTRTEEFVRLKLSRPVASPKDSTHLVTAASWVPGMLGRYVGDAGLDETAVAALASEDVPTLRRRLLRTTDGQAVNAVRLELARRALADGELQQAELLLLENLAAGDDEASRQELERLQSQLGLADAADDGAADRAVDRVRISGRLWSPADEPLRQAYGRQRRSFFTRGAEPIHIVDCGDSRRSRLTVLDLNGGRCLGAVSLEARLRWPLLSRQPERGHLVPVAVVGKVYGFSLLESHRGVPSWAADLPERYGLLPQLGPCGPSFCAVQTRRELTVLDPATGATLWQRIELPPDAGLHGDQAAGLFGDDQALVMLGPDGNSYTVYATRSGEELSRGRLPITATKARRAYGRRLFFIETREEDSVVRVWDPLTGRDDLRIPFEGLLLPTHREDELVLYFGDGRLLIYDVAGARAVVDTRIPALATGDDNAPHSICAFADDRRYYVSLHQTDPKRFEDLRVASFYYDPPLSANHVQTRLMAIDRGTGEVLWSRPTEQRSVLDPVEHRAPVLVAFARVSDRRFGSRKSLLVEAIDKQTGATLAVNDALVFDTPLQFRCRGSRAELAGMTSTVVLDFESDGTDPIACRAEE